MDVDPRPHESQAATSRTRTADGEAESKQPRPVEVDAAGIPRLSRAEEDAIVARVLSWVGEGVPRKPRDPSLVVVFVSIPGLGKTTLSEAVAERLQGTAHVVHVQSDLLDKKQKSGSRFWPLVAGKSVTYRGDGRPTIVLADKNLLDSPPGNMATCAEALLPHSQVLAVVMGDERTAAASGGETASVSDVADGSPAAGDGGGAGPVLPCGLELVASALMRVGQRDKHPGGLHARMKEEGSKIGCYEITSDFAGCLQGHTAAGLLAHVRRHFRRVVAVPALKSATSPLLPPDVIELIEEGLRIDNFGKFGDQRNAYPKGWEERMAHAMQRPDVVTALKRLEMPQAETATALVGAIQEALAQEDGDDAASAEPNSLKNLRYIAVSEFDTTELCKEFERAQVKAGVAVQAAKESLHITVWHSQDPELPDAYKAQLLEALGAEITVNVASFDLAPNISAARAVLLDAPEAAYVNPNSHITMWCAKGTQASKARLLPERVAAGEEAVKHVELDAPIVLRGRLRGFK